MRTNRIAAVGLLTAGSFVAAVVTMTAQRPSVGLSGLVSSQAEAKMEGVVVSAKRAGSTVTVSVMSDAQGRYSFPQDRLTPGSYAVSIRATGYELEGPATVAVTSGKAARLDLALRTARDLASQLTRARHDVAEVGSRHWRAGRARPCDGRG